MLRDRAPAELARRVGLSESRLRHLFKQDTGWSIARYARQVRLALARHLLRYPLLSVKEVAAAVGMDPSHFTRDFTRVFGVSPRKYRSAACLGLPGRGGDDLIFSIATLFKLFATT